MFFGHLASPENDLKHYKDREGCNSPKHRPVQKTGVLFTRDFCQGINKAFQKSRVKSRSEEHTSELQSRSDLVCRLLLEKKKKQRDGGYRAARLEDRHRLDL